MKILICDRQRMLAEALASALDAHGYDIPSATTAIGGVPSSIGDWVPDACLLGLRPGRQSSGPAGLTYQGQSVAQIAAAPDAIEAGRTIIGAVAGEPAAAVAPARALTEAAMAARLEG